MPSLSLRLLPALCLFLSAGPGAFAAIIIFKDGFVLQGNVKQRMTAEIEDQRFIPLRTGPFYLDDGARRIRFSHQQVEAVENKSSPENDVIKLTNFIKPEGLTIPTFMGVGSASDWDKHWQRNFTLITEGGRRIKGITQRIDLLTPQIARVDAVYTYAWSAYYLTDELGPKRVSELLRTHPSLVLKGDKNDAVKRFRIYRFLAQAGWYDLAEKELDSIRKEMPDEKAKVEEARGHLKKLRALQDYDLAELAYRAGRHQWATQQLPRILAEPVDENQKTDLHVLQENYQKAAENLRNAQRLLKELPPEVADASTRSVLAEAAAAIAAEVTIDDFLDDASQARRKATGPQKNQRLRTFLEFATQAERDKKAGKKATQTPTELLALAVTGWLLGGDAAEGKAPSAVKVWRARGFLLDYQRARESATRRRLLEGYERGPKLTAEELAQVIAFLPPPEPAPIADVQELVTEVPHPTRQEIHYFVQLPPEYTSSRAYPVLFMLHDQREKPFDALKRWSEPAAQHGYIVVAPEWARSPEKAYGSTPQEQAGVLDVLRDLRRRFQVDSDRVFLSGLGDGADMTFDVGLAHPDLFAGLLPVSGDPRGIPTQYWPNAQYLPVYDVFGEETGDFAKRNFQLFKNHWIVKGFPAILVEYKGRGREWFPAEVPSMLNWMDRKVRAHALPELGRSGNGGPFGTEFQTLRQADNHFYWLSTSEIDEHHLSEPRWDYRTSPASLDARITEGNVLIVEARNVRDVTIWLGLDMRDRIDFDKPLSIRVNNALRWRRQRVPPSMATLLEDFFERGDRQRLVLAKVSFDRLR